VVCDYAPSISTIHQAALNNIFHLTGIYEYVAHSSVLPLKTLLLTCLEVLFCMLDFLDLDFACNLPTRTQPNNFTKMCDIALTLQLTLSICVTISQAFLISLQLFCIATHNINMCNNYITFMMSSLALLFHKVCIQICVTIT
jgi:hypothetical protein